MSPLQGESTPVQVKEPYSNLDMVTCRIGVQWLSGRVLDSRPRGSGVEPRRRHCVVSLSRNINPSLVLVQPRKIRSYITERLLMGRKESNQTKTCRLSSCNPECTKYTCRLYSKEGLAVLRERKKYEPVREISNNMVCATSKASDQPGHTHSLIRAFASRLNNL